MSVPAHLILGPDRHGVRILAEQLAEQLGAPQVDTWAEAAGHDRVHLHLTDRLAQPDEVRRLAATSRVTVTLHDVPQASDGESFDRRRHTYRALIDGAGGWAVSSQHERMAVHQHLAPVEDGLVAPLPVIPAPATVPDTRRLAHWPPGRTAAVFGFVYPGKGHAELIAAAAAVRDDVEVAVVALGAVAPGHHELVAELTAQADAAGVVFVVTGHLSQTEKQAWLNRVDVGVCGHRNVSASGSTNDWVATGRRPLVREGRYARELTALRPDCYRLYGDADLADQLRTVLHTPDLTRLSAGTDTRPHLADTARCYRDWWAQ